MVLRYLAAAFSIFRRWRSDHSYPRKTCAAVSVAPSLLISRLIDLASSCSRLISRLKYNTSVPFFAIVSKICCASVVLPMPGAAPNMIKPCRIMPPPSRRSRSDMPVAMGLYFSVWILPKKASKRLAPSVGAVGVSTAFSSSVGFCIATPSKGACGAFCGFDFAICS